MTLVSGNPHKKNRASHVRSFLLNHSSVPNCPYSLILDVPALIRPQSFSIPAFIRSSFLPPFGSESLNDLVEIVLDRLYSLSGTAMLAIVDIEAMPLDATRAVIASSPVEESRMGRVKLAVELWGLE